MTISGAMQSNLRINQVFVDTSAFYALVAEGDQRHEEAHRIHEHLKHDAEFTTTNYVMLETVSLLQRRHGVAHAEQIGDFVAGHVGVVWVNAAQHHAAWNAWKTHRNRGLSLVDCVSFVIMRELGLKHAFAFDGQFREAGFLLMTQPPESVAERRGTYRAGRAHR